MRTVARMFACCALVAAMTMAAPQADAAKETWLKRPVLGCATKNDLRTLAIILTELPKGARRTRLASDYARRRCVEIRRGRVSVLMRGEGMACIRQAARTCLWVPEEFVEDKVLDDGVF